MENINARKLVAENKPPVLSLIVWILIVIGAMSIAYEISDWVLFEMTGLNQNDLLTLSSEKELSSNIRFSILLYQGISSFITFIGSSILFFIFYNKANWKDLAGPYKGNLLTYAYTAAILLSFFFVNTYFIDLNSKMNLPEAFDELEKVIKDLEDQLENFTKLLTQFDSFTYFLFSVVVIAIFPALGEELLFRGIFQNIMRTLTGNYHVAIWIAAFIFSAIHMQFYGFLPRLLLGALFGYLYVWSGNLLIPILAHFLNNFISLLLVYIYQLNLIDTDVEAQESFPISIILVFTVIFILLMYSFRKHIKSLSDNG